MIRCIAALVIGLMAGLHAGSAIALSLGNGGVQDVNAHGVCKRITNGSGYTIYIPTDSAAEWSSYYSSSRYGVTIGNCSVNCTVAAGTAWTVGADTCHVPSNFSIADGGSGGTTDSTAPTTGSASWSCSAGVATLQGGASCASAGDNCNALSFSDGACDGGSVASWGGTDPTSCRALCNSEPGGTCCWHWGDGTCVKMDGPYIGLAPGWNAAWTSGCD